MRKPKVVLLLPYRPDSAHRRWLWDVTQPYLEELGHPIFIGAPNGATWSRAEAVNNAATEAGVWDIAIVGDTDTIPDPGAIRRGIAWVRDTGGAVRPHGERYMLTKEGTMELARRGPENVRLSRVNIHYLSVGGGILILTRKAFEAVGGYDEAFQGWGYEDTHINLALLEGPGWDRLPGQAWHLFHPPGKASEKSRQRYKIDLQNHLPAIARWSRNQGLSRPKEVL